MPILKFSKLLLRFQLQPLKWLYFDKVRFHAWDLNILARTLKGVNLERIDFIGGNNHDYRQLISTCAMFEVFFLTILDGKFSPGERMALAKTIDRKGCRLQEIRFVEGYAHRGASRIYCPMIAADAEKNQKLEKLLGCSTSNYSTLCNALKWDE